MTSKYKYQGNPRKPKLGTEKCKCGEEREKHRKECKGCWIAKYYPESLQKKETKK